MISGLLLIWLLDIDGMMGGVILIMCSMPAALFNYLFAQRYGNNAEEVAGTVIVSTILAFILLPFFIGLCIGNRTFLSSLGIDG